MTEADWLACEEPDPVVRWLEVVRWLKLVGSARKLRLFACACCYRVSAVFPESWYREPLEIAEAFADGAVAEEMRHQAHLRIKAEVNAKGGGDSRLQQMFSAVRGTVYGATKSDPGEAAWRAANCAIDVQAHRALDGEEAVQLALARDIFGNPFRPLAFDDAWRTSTAVALACGMYESRDFGAMPILADALQDAGCDNDDILNHCRDPNQVHVRGCWAVDCVLGKV